MFEVLTSHASMIVSLKADLVQVYINDMHESENIFFSEGKIEVTGSYVNITTETGINAKKLSKAGIATKLLIFKNLH